MIDDLKSLQPGDMLTVDDVIAQQLTGTEDYAVTNVEAIPTEFEQIVIVEMDDYYLIANDLSGEESFAICEFYDEGHDYLDNDGVTFLDKITLESGEGTVVYECEHADSENVFCEYLTSDTHYNYLVVQRDGDTACVYRGITISEDAVVI